MDPYTSMPDGDWPSGPGIFSLPYPQGWAEYMGSGSGQGTVPLSKGSFQTSVTNGLFQVTEHDYTPTFIGGQSAGDLISVTSTYDSNSENLLDQITYTFPYAGRASGDLSISRKLQTQDPVGDATYTVETATTYNFSGQPLTKTLTDGTYIYPSNGTTRQATTSYAYWDGTKYFQQKGTKDQAGRYTYTDYYPNTATAGSRGQQYQVYDPAHAGFYLNTNITPPSYAQSSDYWKYQLTPTAGNDSAQFAYDSKGRCTDVYKLQKTTTSPWSYVHTVTSYGADGSPIWGQASQVVEDYGGLNRTTSTLAYTSWGKPSKVQDAAGHQFNTNFDLDGNVQNVTRVDSGLNQTVASYTYGVSGISNGQPTSISDGLSGVTDSITYQPSGTGVGQVSSTLETNGSTSYSVTYAFNATGIAGRARM